MRPVNLIPPEDRRGDRAASRTGALAYIVVGVLAVALLGVVGVVLTDNQIADSRAQVSDLEAQLGQATSQANQLKSYASFAGLETARDQTVTTLAKSRFDWYRVLRELALVIPSSVWLTDLKGTVTPADAAEVAGASSAPSSNGSSAADVTSQITGPSLSITGCAAGHAAVAEFLGALRDIDGVTRVVVTQSQRSEPGQALPSSGGSSGCDARDFIAEFQVVVAFDKVPVDPTTGLIAPTGPASTSSSAPTSSPASATTTAATAAAGVGSGVRHKEAAQAQSAAKQTQKAHQTVSAMVPGTVQP